MTTKDSLDNGFDSRIALSFLNGFVKSLKPQKGRGNKCVIDINPCSLCVHDGTGNGCTLKSRKGCGTNNFYLWQWNGM